MRVLAILVLLAPASLSGQDVSPDLRKKADAVRASAERMLKPLKVPWVTDLFEGFRLSKEEKRPVFLYMITGDPLEDC